MKSIFVTPGGLLAGDLRIPGDKSITHRALLFAGLGQGESEIVGGLASEDTMATAGILRALGVECNCAGQRWSVRSKGLHAFRAPAVDLDCGNSGTTARLMMGLLCAQPFSSRLIGDASLSRRPMERVMKPLEQMGARFESTGGTLPLRILAAPQAGLRAIAYESPVASAQVKSAIVLAGLYAQGKTSVREPSLSRDHTERLLGAQVNLQRHQNEISFDGPVKALSAGHFVVPGDFSTAAFFLVAGALYAKGNLRLENVGVNPTRLGLWDALERMGVKMKRTSERTEHGEAMADLIVERSKELQAIEVSGELTLRAIDEIPIWAVAAARAKGRSVLRDAQELRVKESDRLAAIAENLKRMGVAISLAPDGFSIEGRPEGLLHPQRSGYGPGHLESYGDHRIAMAMAIAALGVAGHAEAIEMRDTACIATSFPTFTAQLRALLGGGGVEERAL